MDSESKEKFSRKKYFINPSIQLKYIIMSVVPALITVLFSTYFLFKASEVKLQKQKESFMIQVTTLESTIKQLEGVTDNFQVKQNIQRTKKELAALQDVMERRAAVSFRDLRNIRDLLIIFLFLILILVGIVALVFSHRIVGPLYRICRYVDMMAEGKEKDLPIIRLRDHDEYQELADSLERLRKRIIGRNAPAK